MALPPSEIGARIKRIRTEVGIPREELATAFGTTTETVDLLEAGDLEPLPGDLVLIAARLLQTDFRLLISTDLDDIEEETRKVFRALSEPKPADLLAIRRFNTLCLNEVELESLLGIRKPTLPPRYPLPDMSGKLHKVQGIEAAREERRRLSIGTRPIANVFEVLRSQGVRLFRQRLEDSNLSGLTVLHPRAGVSVLVNYDDDLYRQFFSASHEYAHVLFDRSRIEEQGCVVSYRYTRGQLVEIRANAFAGEFLLPTEALRAYDRPRDLASLNDAIERIARDYRVNTEPVAIKAREVGWISDRTLQSFRQVRPVTISRDEKLDPDIPEDLTPAQASRRAAAIEQGLSASYLELLRRALAGDEITFGRFAEMLDMPPREAEEFIKSAGLAT